MASGQPLSASAQTPFAIPQPSVVPPQMISPAGQSAPQSASPPSKQNLRTWWKGFKTQGKAQETPAPEPSGIFGVPLRQSITYANVAISLIDANGKSYIYGYVPIVVAKCGVYLKEKATNVEGIFRLSGSEKRIKELRVIFDSPDRFGKGLDWEGYTVHDAANVLRRYLNQLPEPIVPLDLYDRFREPLRGQQHALANLHDPRAVGNFDLGKTIAIYQQLITELPPLNRQLLLYLLDLLAVFASKSDENRMTSANLAAIFQPGMLSHPSHDMAPDEYRLSQDVLVFLIENQDHFLIGMRGTAADEQTVQDVQRGGTPPVGTPSTPSQGGNAAVDRSPSTASAGADSLRKQGGIRRNVSVNSRHSRQSNGAPSPASPAYGPPLTHSNSGGVHRSNTLPSKRSPGLSPGRSPKSPGSRSPTTAVSPSNALEIGGLSGAPSPSTQSAELPLSSHGVPLATMESSTLPTESHGTGAAQSQDRLLPDSTEWKPEPTTPRGLFQRSPPSDGEKRAPNKLRKKRIPGSSNESAQSSTNSLQDEMDAPSPTFAPVRKESGSVGLEDRLHLDTFPSTGPILMNTEATPTVTDQEQKMFFDAVKLKTERSSDGTLKPQASSNSLNSRLSTAEPSDVEHGEDAVVASEQKEKRRLFRLSRKKDDQSLSGSISSPKPMIGTNGGAEKSTSSFTSSRGRKSVSGEGGPTSMEPVPAVPRQASNDSGTAGKEDKKGPIDWIKNKMREAKEEKRGRDAESKKERAAKATPSERAASTSTVGEQRGKSIDLRLEGGLEGNGYEEAASNPHSASPTAL